MNCLGRRTEGSGESRCQKTSSQDEEETGTVGIGIMGKKIIAGESIGEMARKTSILHLLTTVFSTTSGTCTLTLAFLRDLSPWPGKPQPPYPDKYDISYVTLYQYAKALFDECLWRQGKLGWFAPGKFRFSWL